jgi:hypothetical protein
MLDSTFKFEELSLQWGKYRATYPFYCLFLHIHISTYPPKIWLSYIPGKNTGNATVSKPEWSFPLQVLVIWTGTVMLINIALQLNVKSQYWLSAMQDQVYDTNGSQTLRYLRITWDTCVKCIIPKLQHRNSDSFAGISILIICCDSHRLCWLTVRNSINYLECHL